jgi:hypothetical protein
MLGQKIDANLTVTGSIQGDSLIVGQRANSNLLSIVADVASADFELTRDNVAITGIESTDIELTRDSDAIKGIESTFNKTSDPPDMGKSGHLHTTTLSIGANSIHAGGVYADTFTPEREILIYPNSIQAKQTLWGLIEKRNLRTGELETFYESSGLFCASLILQPEGGKVGIGTDNPSGDLQINRDSSANVFLCGDTTHGENGLRVHYSKDLQVGVIDVRGNSLMLRGTQALGGDAGSSPNERVFIDLQSGNVGIGTPSPKARLDIQTDYGQSCGLILRDVTGQERFWFNPGSSFMEIKNANGQQLFTFGSETGLFLRDTMGRETFRFDTAHNQLSMKDANGIEVFTVDGGGAMFLRDASGANRIHFNASSNHMFIKDANGMEVLTFDGSSGNLSLPGDIRLTGGADCAEEFEIANDELVDAGSVMIIDETGALKPAHRAYDKRVAGVISGAGTLKPGIILDRHDARDGRLPVALVGKVYCKVDAQYDSIEVGDLLTTSATPAHAMKATDPSKAFGTVIGKALGALKNGQGLIPILVALQ